MSADKWQNPVRGPQRVMFESPIEQEQMSSVRLRQPAGELEALLDGSGYLFVPMHYLEPIVGGPVFLEVSKATIRGVLDGIRNRLLNWVLELQARGIVGEGYSFTPDEKRTAHQGGTSIHFHAPVTHASVQNQSPGSTINVTDAVQLAAIRTAIDRLLDQLSSVQASDEEREEAKGALVLARTEAQKPSPSMERIRSSMTLATDTIRTFAAGGALLHEAQRLMAMIL